MHITILAHGSRGDVQPYVALGVGLQKAGHRVRLAAPALFEAFALEYGLEFASLAGDPQVLAQALADTAGSNPVRTVREIAKYTLPVADQVQRDVFATCADTDLVIHSFLTTLAGDMAAREYNLPQLSASIFPVFSTTSEFPGLMFPYLGLGAWYNRLTHYLFTQNYWQGSRLGYNLFVRRKQPGRPVLQDWPFTRPDPVPILYGISPHVLPRPRDWGRHTYMPGYWFLEAQEAWQPPSDLLAFLDAGEAPVYVGFGSMITSQAERLVDVALGALAKTGQRGLLLTGWGGISTADLPDTVYKIDAAPHDWLFPRMKALVHHGGAGTTAAGLRAGVPTIITPFTADQPFWGQRVYRLDAGPKPIPRRKLTVDGLAEAIRVTVRDAGMRQRATELGERIRGENGVARSVALIEELFG